jgi:predicted peptidase
MSNNDCDVSRIYIVGCSIGATGTWCQLSNYPNFYAAAMPIAGDPTGYNAANVATTPVRTIMGSADVVMPLNNVQTFQPAVIAAGGTLLLDILDGADHVTTCNTAFTTDRLDWLFAQKRSSETGIIGVMSITSNNDAVYDLYGRRVSNPQKGIYIQNSKKVIF